MAQPTLIEDPNDPGTYLIQMMPSGDSESSPGGGTQPSIPAGPGAGRPADAFRLDWSLSGTRLFETGVDRGVVYIEGKGYPWTGLTAVNETPDGGESKPYYLDGVKYYNGSTMEEYKATIEAFTYPDEFMDCDGSAPMMSGMFITQQRRKSFDFCYRTLIGNDVAGVNHAYKLHLVYNATATPTAKNYTTLGDTSEPSTFSWTISTRRKRFEDVQFGVKYGSHIVIDSRTTYPWAMEVLENVLYGRPGASGTQAYMPSPEELVDIFVDNALLKITDHEDGTWSAEGPDSVISMLSDDKFQIDWPSAVYLPGSTTTYTVNNL